MERFALGAALIFILASCFGCSGSQGFAACRELGAPVYLDPALFTPASGSLEGVSLHYFDNQNLELDPQTLLLTSPGKDILEPGTYYFELEDENRKVTPCSLTVSDTTSPSFVRYTPLVQASLNEPLDLNKYFEADDLSGVQLSFYDEPDYTKKGRQTLRIQARDAFGNTAIQSFTLELN